MPLWFPRSTFGLVLAVIYVAVAIFVFAGDRSNTTGGWISLNGTRTFLVTFPVSSFGEPLAKRPNIRRNAEMTFAIGICGLLVYFFSDGLANLARLVVQS